ncbi:MAG: Maf family protein [archaeon]
MKKRIILATTSPRRHSLAKTMGLDFEVVASEYEEDMSLKLKPKELVMKFAHGKAADVAKKFDGGIVIGVDTIVVHNGKNIGKPRNEKEACKLLKSYSGKKHYVYSGVCLIDCKTGRTIQDCEITEVHFRKMEDGEIKKYIKTGEPGDKGGGYGIQGLASIFIKKINGCYYNVMGFPIYNIYKNLRKMGADVLEHESWNGKLDI